MGAAIGTQYTIEDAAPAQSQYTIEDAPPAHPGPLDRLSAWGERKFPQITPVQARTDPRLQQYDTFKKHPELARTLLNVDTGVARNLTAMPAAIAGWFKAPWKPGQAIREHSAGGTPVDASKLPPVTREQVDDYLSETASQVGAGVIAGEVGGLALKGVGKVLPKISNPITRTITDTTPRETVAAVRDASADNAAKAGEHKAATEAALHETEGRELKHQQDTKTANDAAEASRKADIKKHLETREKSIADRKEAERKLAAEQAKQGKIDPTQEKLEKEWGNLRAGIETAREKALKVGNEKYSAVNESLSPLSADMESVHSLYQDASNALGETQAVPSLITRLGKSLQDGELLTYKDEQALYSELGKELSKGTLPGSTYHAFDVLHEGIGNDMQRIADSQGMGADLTDARAYWRRMKQTFGKPLNLGDAATKALGKSASGLATDDATSNQLRLLGSFDPDIPRQFNHVTNIQKGVDSLPDPKSARELTQGAKAPPIPARKPVIPKVKSEVAPPERVAPPDRPTETTFTASTLADLKKKNLLKATDQLRHSKSPLVSAVAGYGTIKALLLRNLPTAGLDITARVLYGAAKPALANILENPRVVAELTKFTAKDAAAIAKLSPEERASFVGDMSAVVKGAQDRGIKVSPALLGVVATSNPAPKKRVAAALTQ